MDRSLKLLIGVLGIAGFLAVLVPTSIPAPPKAPVLTAADAVVATPVEENDDPEIEETEPADDSEDEYYIEFGQPSIDGKPFSGGDDDSSSDSYTNNAVNSPVSQVAAPQMNLPSNAPEPLAPGTIIPVN